MADSVVTFEKPVPHVELSDWIAGLGVMQRAADEKRQNAFAFRHSSRNLRNETKVKTEYDTYRNDSLLKDRIQEVMEWRSTTQDLLEQVIRELETLKDEKATTERELEALNTSIFITSDCLSNRDARKSTELTIDNAMVELKKELCVEDANKKMLAEYCQMSWEKINSLEKLKFDLTLDIVNKTETLAIDYDQLTLNKDCANIGTKPNPLRDPKHCISQNQWLDNQKHFLSEGQRGLRLALGAREQLFLARGKAKNTMKAQCDATDYSLRKRIYDTKRAHTELKWQKGKMEDNMAKLVTEMSTLGAAMLAKNNAQKLAETRLENRCYRPAAELSLDATDQGLKKEVKDVKQTIKTLREKFDLAKSTYNDLENMCLKITTDLDDKTNTMEIDIRALEMRDAAKELEAGSQADRSVELVRFSGRIIEE